MTVTDPTAVFEKLINDSADLCRLGLVLGKTPESLHDEHVTKLQEIGFNEDAANMVAGVIVSRAKNGLEYSEARRKVLSDYILSMAGKKVG